MRTTPALGLGMPRPGSRSKYIFLSIKLLTLLWCLRLRARIKGLFSSWADHPATDHYTWFPQMSGARDRSDRNLPYWDQQLGMFGTSGPLIATRPSFRSCLVIAVATTSGSSEAFCSRHSAWGGLADPTRIFISTLIGPRWTARQRSTRSSSGSSTLNRMAIQTRRKKAQVRPGLVSFSTVHGSR